MVDIYRPGEPLRRTQKIIQNISMGIVDRKAAWVFHYANGTQESFSLHPGVARQFMQGLQELVLILEQEPKEKPAPTNDGVSMQEGIQVRLLGGDTC